MFEAVHDAAGRGVAAYASSGLPRHEWALAWPGQVVLVVAGIYWTRGVEAAIQVTTVICRMGMGGLAVF